MSSLPSRLAGPVAALLLALAPASAEIARPPQAAGITLALRVTAQLRQALPGEPVEVRMANAGLVLSGRLSGPAALQTALALAETHAPGRVANLMTTGQDPLVTITLGLAEMPPSVAQNLTASMAVAGVFALDRSDAATGDLPGLVPGGFDLPGLVAALEAKGVLRLHEGPVLTVPAGETARLAPGGGCGIGAGGGALGLTPVLGEATQITLALTPCGGAAPVTIGLRDGQSVAVAGVLPPRAQLSGDPVFGPALAGAEGGLTEVMLLISARVVPEAPADRFIGVVGDRNGLPEPFTLSTPLP